MSEYAKEFPRRVVLVDPADNSDYAASGGGGGGGTVSLDQTTPGTTESVTVKASGGIGSLTETAPASDTASAALNGRLQRVAQRLTSLIALLPAALSGAGNLKTAVSEALPAGTNLLGTVGIDQTTPGTTNAVSIKSTATLTNVSSTAYESSHVLSATAKKLYGLTGYNSKTASQFIQLHDASSLPSDTAVPSVIFIVPAGSNFAIDFGINGRNFTTGIVVCNSSTGPTKTIGSADCWFDAQVL